jgi:hypothetical protein
MLGRRGILGWRQWRAFKPTAEQCVMCTKSHQLKEKSQMYAEKAGDTKRQQQTVGAPD